ncbi:hypothetical protein CPB84DRAFT_1116832 [Gymnopilus junonius]|uniref:DUF6535 domain-containing protein n=1 Tax=Gymnopilus junonius TaxID=109634 RepID=A0A9P5TLQ0_GYMJU|nr:hypothetical protein CPB84DRAFT_1116832 [Gymnopilus junonius]
MTRQSARNQRHIPAYFTTHQSINNIPYLLCQQKFALCNMQAEDFEAWYVPHILSLLPIFLQMALVLFFMGLTGFLLSASSIVRIPVIILTGIINLFSNSSLLLFILDLPFAGPPVNPYFLSNW